MIQKASEFIYKYVLFFLPEGETHPWDYVAHFIVSFALVLAIFLIGNKVFGASPKSSLVIAILATLVIGTLKEFDDWRIGNTDIVADMASNLAGVGIALAIILLFMLFVHRST